MARAPIIFQWTDDGVMRPVNDMWAKRADARFVVGMLYRMEEVVETSDASRRHYFAVIKDAWESLPDHLASAFETPEHLRKFALIKAGYHDKRTIACESVREARRVAAFIRPMDSYAIVTTEEALVQVFTAQSQSAREMKHGVFQKSKTAVLEFIEGMLQAEPGSAEKIGGGA